MLKGLLFSFTLMYLQVNFAMAQTKEIIIYTHESKINFESETTTTPVDDEEEEFGFGDLKAFLDSMAKPRVNHLTCWRQGDDVIMVRKENDGTLLHTYFDVDKLLFKVVDSSNLAKTGKPDTSIISWNFKNFPDWQVTYNIVKTEQRKTILGYPCTLYTIEEVKITEQNGKPDRQTISLWATDAIRPAISTHAVLAFYDNVLAHLTPLEVEMKRETERGGTYQKLTAIKIQHQP